MCLTNVLDQIFRSGRNTSISIFYIFPFSFYFDKSKINVFYEVEKSSSHSNKFTSFKNSNSFLCFFVIAIMKIIKTHCLIGREHRIKKYKA